MKRLKIGLLLAGTIFVAVPLAGKLSGHATGDSGAGCGGSEATVEHAEDNLTTVRACAPGVYFFEGVPVEVVGRGPRGQIEAYCLPNLDGPARAALDRAATGAPTARSVQLECRAGRLRPRTALHACYAPDPEPISCAAFRPLAGSAIDTFRVFRVSPEEYRLEAAAGSDQALDLDLRSYREGPASELDLSDALEDLRAASIQHRTLRIFELQSALRRMGQQSTRGLSELALQRVACVVGWMRFTSRVARPAPPRTTAYLPQALAPTLRFTDRCLWKQPDAPECAAIFDVREHGAHGKYHPLYRADWSTLTPGYTRRVLPQIPRPTVYELLYDHEGKTDGQPLYPFSPDMNPSAYLAALREETTADLPQRLERFESRLDESTRQATALRRHFQGRLHGPSSLRRRLILTGNPGYTLNQVPKDTEVVVLPSPLRVYVGTRPVHAPNTETAVFRIDGYEEVLVEDLDIEVLPHPDMAWAVEDPQVACASASCTDTEKRQLLEYFFPSTTSVGRWDRVAHAIAAPTPSTTDDKIAQMRALQSSVPQAERLARHDDDGDGAILGAERDDGYYAHLWEQWTEALDMMLRMTRAGHVFHIHDNDLVTLRNLRVRSVVRESVVHLSSNRHQTVERVLIEGAAATRIKELPEQSYDPVEQAIPPGLSVDDPQTGFVHFQNGDVAPIDINGTYYLGSGIAVHNGTNAANTPEGANCCYNDTTGELVEGCDPANPEPQAFDYTDHSHRVATSGMNDGCRARAQEQGFDPYLCDNRWTSIVSSTIRRCSTDDFSTMDGGNYDNMNKDGLLIMATTGLVFNNLFQDFRASADYGCDTLLDVAQRAPCDRRPEALARALRIERNRFVQGDVKNEGTSEPETTNLFANNEFINVALVDYHRKWRANYIYNTWLDRHFTGFAEGNGEAFLWNQTGFTPHVYHQPYFGQLRFLGNLVRHTRTLNIFQQATARPFSQAKFRVAHNEYLASTPSTTKFLRNNYNNAAVCQAPAPLDHPLEAYDPNDPATHSYTVVSAPDCDSALGVLKTPEVPKKDVRGFEDTDNDCNNDYRCIFQDSTSGHTVDPALCADLQSTSARPASLDPYFDHFRGALRGTVGQHLRTRRFINSTLYNPWRSRVQRDFTGRNRVYTVAGARHPPPLFFPRVLPSSVR